MKDTDPQIGGIGIPHSSSNGNSALGEIVLDRSDMIITDSSHQSLRAAHKHLNNMDSIDDDDPINNSGDDLIRNTNSSASTSTNASPEISKSSVSNSIPTISTTPTITLTNSTTITTSPKHINDKPFKNIPKLSISPNPSPALYSSDIIPSDISISPTSIEGNDNSKNNSPTSLSLNNTEKLYQQQQQQQAECKIKDNKLYNNVSLVTPISSPPVTQIQVTNTPKQSNEESSIPDNIDKSNKSEETIDISIESDYEKEKEEARKVGFFHYLKFLFNKNKHRMDIKGNKRFYLAAQIITRFGFFSKFLMYVTLGCISIAAAVDKTRQVVGPAGAFEELQEMFSGGVSFLLIIGLWCYGTWGIFFVVFDIDQLGRKTAGAILKRFGRIFSSGFYFVLGVDAAQVLARTRHGDTKSGTEQILILLYKHVVGKIVVCLIGIVMFVVSIVYLVYFIKPDKFKKELSTERMTKGLYYTALAFARIGAIGRSMFFGAFGACLIQAVAQLNKGKEADPSLLGFQGVFSAIARFNSTLLFIIAALVVVYAFWCLWLVPFRRLPAHADAKRAQDLLGTKLDPNLKFNGIIFHSPRHYEEELQEGDSNNNYNNNSDIHE